MRDNCGRDGNRQRRARFARRASRETRRLKAIDALGCAEKESSRSAGETIRNRGNLRILRGFNQKYRTPTPRRPTASSTTAVRTTASQRRLRVPAAQNAADGVDWEKSTIRFWAPEPQHERSGLWGGFIAASRKPHVVLLTAPQWGWARGAGPDTGGVGEVRSLADKISTRIESRLCPAARYPKRT